MKVISFLLTLWFFYMLFHILIKPIFLSLLIFLRHRQRIKRRGPAQNNNPRANKSYSRDSRKIIDAEFEEVE
jgi:hypothetical protein